MLPPLPVLLPSPPLPQPQLAGADKPEFLTSMDLHEDACIVINAEGIILMANSVRGGDSGGWGLKGDLV